jgi:fermentation-respiration switch protein FrsA (DUF1100 family)
LLENFYSPRPGSEDRKGAAIIVGHPYTGVKEQTAAFYAKFLAENGFHALAFDAAYQGESKGEPRGLENPAQRVEDFAVSYLTTLTGKVDPERIGALGICGGGGYVSAAAQSDVRIKAVIPIVPFDTGYAVRHAGPNADDKFNPQAIAGALQLSASTRNKEVRGEKIDVPSMMPDSIDTLPSSATFFRRGWQYYKTAEGQHPRSDSKVHPRSFDMMVTYDSFAFMNLISPRPVLVIGAETAETLHFAQTAYNNAQEPKELYIVPGKGHFDLYHDATETGPKILNFFSLHLSN